MQAQQQLAAVHYFYLLKDDEDLTRIWSRLTASAAGTVIEPPAWELAPSESEMSGRCSIIHRIQGQEVDYCLVMLPDLAIIEIIYPSPAGSTATRWQWALQRIEEQRDLALAEDVTIYGESTLLIAPETGEEELERVFAAVSDSSEQLLSELNPAVAGGFRPLLLHLPDFRHEERHLYALAADHPEPLTTMLPEVDSAIKKLKRSANYFKQQRNTIIAERSRVDSQVGALLHQQVVSGNSQKPDPEALEEKIVNLSKMFGLLATDSLLVRQAEDRLGRDLRLLEAGLKPLVKKDGAGRDEIGSHYLPTFQAELAAVRAEISDLGFSRNNAQAAIEVVRTQVELLRAGEEAAIQAQTKELLTRSLVLQQERLALQVAAGFVEFVLVFYYVLKAWEGIAGAELVEHLSPLSRLVVVAGMASGAALGTHFLAQSLQRHTWKILGLWLSVAVIILSLTGMIILTVTFS